jgi:hypothetical protein
MIWWLQCNHSTIHPINQLIMQSSTHAILALLVVGAVATRQTDRVSGSVGGPLWLVTGACTGEVAVAPAARRTYGEYLGTYDLGEHGAFEVSYREGRLLGELSLRKGPVELFPAPGRPDQFYARAVPATFVFSRNAKGSVESLVISVDGKGDMKGTKKQKQ